MQKRERLNPLDNLKLDESSKYLSKEVSKRKERESVCSTRAVVFESVPLFPIPRKKIMTKTLEQNESRKNTNSQKDPEMGTGKMEGENGGKPGKRAF